MFITEYSFIEKLFSKNTVIVQNRAAHHTVQSFVPAERQQKSGLSVLESDSYKAV